MRNRSPFFVILASVFLSVSCGGSSSDGGGGSAPIPRDQALQRFIDAVCGSIAPCCQQSGYTFDDAGCRSMWGQTLQEGVFGYQATTTYDAALAAQCLDQVTASVNSCGILPTTTACRGMVKGALPEGASCSASFECAAPAGGDASCSDAKCVQYPRGKSGEPCGETCTEGPGLTTCYGGSSTVGTAICFTNDGLACGMSGNCEPLAKGGQPCTSGGCEAGMFCNGQACVQQSAAGHTCQNSDGCVDSAYCDFDTGNCTVKKANGQVCQSSDECAGGRCAENKCAQRSVASSSICTGT
ncbi:MAG: hypothetical protein R3B13_06640 [Polyangiaceae bacterium]